jgi:hypothetical protein
MKIPTEDAYIIKSDLLYNLFVFGQRDFFMYFSSDAPSVWTELPFAIDFISIYKLNIIRRCNVNGKGRT